MKSLKENKRLQFALGAILLVLLCFNLPNLLFFPLCIKEDIFRPPNTEVLVSACKQPFATGVPGGEVVFVYEGRTGKYYLLDLRTGEKKKLPDDLLLLDRGVFLNSELVWLEGSWGNPNNTPGYRPHYILDLRDGKRYEVLDLDWLPRAQNGYFDPRNYSYLKSAENIFIHHSKNIIIALSSDFHSSPSGSVVLSQYALKSRANAENGVILEKLLKDLGTGYEIIDFSLRYTNVPSPIGRYIIRDNGVYFSGDTKAIIERRFGGYYDIGYFRGWYYDDSGLVVQNYPDYLISTILGAQYFPVPKPILKLYLSSSLP